MYEASAPDRWHETWASADGKFAGEIVLADGRYYWNSISGGWTDTTEPPLGAPSPTDTVNAIGSFVADVSRTTETDWQGTPVWTYTFTINGGPGTALIGARDGLPYHVDAQNYAPELGDISSVWVYEYNVSLNIQPPVP